MARPPPPPERATDFMCHRSCVICHIKCVICHMSCVICHLIFLKGLVSTDFRERVKEKKEKKLSLTVANLGGGNQQVGGHSP